MALHSNRNHTHTHSRNATELRYTILDEIIALKVISIKGQDLRLYLSDRLSGWEIL